MDKGTLAAKTQVATERAVTAAQTVISRHNLPPELAEGVTVYYRRDPGITLMRRMEGIADLLEALAGLDPAQNAPETAVAQADDEKEQPAARRPSPGKKGAK